MNYVATDEEGKIMAILSCENDSPSDFEKIKLALLVKEDRCCESATILSIDESRDYNLTAKVEVVDEDGEQEVVKVELTRVATY
jgi:hypothetical protein